MKHLIVANEKAGATKDLETFKAQIEEAFNGLDHELYLTEGPRKVIPFLRKYLKENAKETVRVYACGGDGTIHEVVNGLVGFPNAELAILAVGTGNDFVKIYSEKPEYEEIVKNKTGENRFKDFKSLIKGEVTPIDLSKISGDGLEEPWYSNNVINFGFDAIVGARGNANKLKGKKNPYGFRQAILPAIMKGRFNKIIVKADGEQLNKKKLLLCSISQGQWVGGEYHASPKSNNTDGLMDVVILHCMSFATLMGKYFGKYKVGEHLDNPKLMKKITYRQAKKVEIIAPKNIDICIDGEIINGQHFEVEVVPGAIKLVLPKE